MTHDFGVRVKSKGVLQTPAALILLGVGVGVIVAVLTASRLQNRKEGIAVAHEWAVSGPPCLVVQDRAALSNSPAAKRTFAFGDVIFARAFGHASCQMVVHDAGRGVGSYPVCQFSSPAALAVTVKGRTTYFSPPRGSPATIAIRHGAPSCVLAAPEWK